MMPVKDEISIHASKVIQYDVHRKKWSDCERCDLGNRARHHVLGRGQIPADVLFIGEGPGRHEDQRGYAFVGAAGKILQSALELLESTYCVTWFLSNLVACRPCETSISPNRAPRSLEVVKCQPRIEELLELVEPKIVIVLGSIPKSFLTDAPYLRSYFTRTAPHPAWVCYNGGTDSAAYQTFINVITNAIDSFIVEGSAL